MSLETVPFDRSYKIVELFEVEYYRELEMWITQLTGQSRS